MRNQIVIKKIKDEFFSDNPGLLEIMDDKDRGYGYIQCLIDGYNFAIPLRSSIRHNHCFVTSTPHDGVGVKGLDYTKAIIVPPSYLAGTFVIDNREYRRIFRNQNNIINTFNDYINNYKMYAKGYEIPDEYGHAYQYTTLINYHSELNI